MGRDLPVKSIKTTFRIIDYLAKEGGNGVSTIASDLGLALTTTYDHINTLAALGYIEKQNSEYHLTTRFLELGERTRAQIPVHSTVGDILTELANSTDEVATLWIVENDLSVILDIARGSKAIPLAPYPGTRIELHRSGPGKAILAHLSPQRAEAILEQHPPGKEGERYGIPSRTEYTISTYENLINELETIREQGYALDNEELIEGVRSVGVPLFDHKGNVVGAVGVHGPTSRFHGEKFTETFPEKLIEVQSTVELEYKYS